MGACFVVWVLLVPFCRGACGSCALPAHWAAGVPAASEPAGRVSFLCVRGVKGVPGGPCCGCFVFRLCVSLTGRATGSLGTARVEDVVRVLPSGGTWGFGGENCFFSRRHVRASLLVAARGNEGFASGLKCTRCRIPAFLLFSCDVRAAAWPRERAYWSPVAAGDAPPRAATFHHFCRDLIAALNSAELLTLLCRATNRYNVFVFFLLTLRKELFQLLDTVADTSGRGTLS